MDGVDPIVTQIGLGMQLSYARDKEGARLLFAQVWSDIGGDAGDPFHRCAIAHAMADVQDNTELELQWDLRALEAAQALSNDRAIEGGVPGGARSLYPSLHLNLAECYRKLGDPGLARHHLQKGRATLEGSTLMAT